MRRRFTVSEKLHLQQEDRACDWRRKSEVPGMSQLQYMERKCAVKRESCAV